MMCFYHPLIVLSFYQTTIENESLLKGQAISTGPALLPAVGSEQRAKVRDLGEILAGDIALMYPIKLNSS